MKKNFMMRAASVLLVAVMLTTCAISGTFAKYVTRANGNDVARVADWGVYAAITGDAFLAAYERTDTSYTNTATTVVSSTDDKLVAPGTDGTFTGLALTGSPEVATRISFEGTSVDLTGWVVGETYYCPIVFTFNGEVIKGLDYDNEAALEAALYAAITKGAGDYAPNTDLSTIDKLNGDYSWAWAFDGTVGGDARQTDELDTALGNIEADNAEVDTNTITITVVTTIEQID